MLNMTGVLSDSTSRVVKYCPVAVENQFVSYYKHFEQFDNSTIGEIAESFLFGILVQSLEMRQAL